MKFITYDVNTVFDLTLKKLGNVFKWAYQANNEEWYIVEAGNYYECQIGKMVVTFTKMYITGNNTVIFYLNDIEILKVVGC